jgi:peptidyl-prolyl cis-trans isomerase D
MFDAVRNNRRLVQVFLALITLPFAFWGVESYVRSVGSSGEIASVGGTKITQLEFQQALQLQQEKIRASVGPNVTADMLDTPQIRQSVLDSLVDQHLIAMQVSKSRIAVSDAELFQYISSAPALQENGKFSPERYGELAASKGMTKLAFDARLRRDIAMQRVASPITEGVLTGKEAGQRWLAAMLEEREVAEAALMPEQYTAAVKLDPTAVKAYYDSNKAAFAVPEQARAEFVVLSQKQLEQEVSVSEDDIKAAYAAHQDQYQQAEQRRASHILINVAKNASAADVIAAQIRAKQVLELAKQKNADFAALAKQHSQDTGSAQKGGDLDWFGRGAMVKAFEDKAFSLKEGELSDLVRSDFGFHIIKLTGIRAEHVKPLEEARGEIAQELRSKAAAKKYAELAESFNNTVYEQADSLKPAADKFKLKVEQSEWISKANPGATILANPKLLTALFADDSIKNKHNTEAVEVASKTLVAAHVIEYRPATVRPFEEVRSEVEKKLTLEEAAKLCHKDGEDKLAKLGKGESVDLNWGAPHNLPRIGAQGFSREATKAIFQTPSAKLPAFAGIVQPTAGYSLYRVSQVKPFAGGDDQRAKALLDQYARVMAGEDFTAWLSVLRKRYPVEINSKALEVKDH